MKCFKKNAEYCKFREKSKCMYLEWKLADVIDYSKPLEMCKSIMDFEYYRTLNPIYKHKDTK